MSANVRSTAHFTKLLFTSTILVIIPLMPIMHSQNSYPTMNTHLSNLVRTNLSLIPKSVITGIIAILWTIFIYSSTVMVFDTNDDVGRSMRVHGYGYFVTGSPYTLYSNWLWGWFISFLPQIGGLYAYYWVTIVILCLSLWAFAYYLWQILPAHIAIITTGIAVTYSMVAPQFTINAGLMTIAMILAIQHFQRTRQHRHLGIALGFALIALLIRERQFMLNLIAAWAFLVINKHISLRSFSTMSRRTLLMAATGMALICSIVGFNVLTQTSNPTYVRINALRSAYDPIEDYNALEFLKTRRDIVDQSGFSINDLRMIGRYFWHTDELTDLKKLEALNQHIRTQQLTKIRWDWGIDAVQTLQQPIFLALLIPVFGIILTQRNPILLLSTVTVFAMVWGFGIIGRGAMFRVTFPLIISLFILALTVSTSRKRVAPWMKYITTATYLVALIMHCQITWRQHTVQATLVEKIQRYTSEIDLRDMYVTGFAFPATFLYPLNKPFVPDSSMPITIFNLSIIEPGNVYMETQRDFDGELTSPNGIHLMATANEYTLIQEYCWAKYQGILQTSDIHVNEYFTVRNARCTNSPFPHRNNRYLSYGMIP